jgi:hypothetical protein
MSATSLSKREHLVYTMFEASTSVQLDDDQQALFWVDKWLDGGLRFLDGANPPSSSRQEEAKHKVGQGHY